MKCWEGVRSLHKELNRACGGDKAQLHNLAKQLECEIDPRDASSN